MTSQQIVDTFTDLAPTYEVAMSGELATLWGLEYQEFVQLLVDRAQIRENDWVLDLATGTAQIPRAIASNDTTPGRILGVDITMAMLREGQRAVAAIPLPVGVELVCGSGMQMPFQSGVFDLITCGLGMHHMHVPTTLAQLRRTLNADGRLLVVAVGAPRFWRWPPVTFLLRLLTFAYFWFKDKKPRAWAESEAFSSVFSPLEWHSHLQEAGFQNIQIETLLIGRRFWYPNAIVITAQKGA